MCKKLIIVSLVVVVLSMPALAAYIGYPSGCANPLKVDLTYAPDPQSPIPGWQNWGFQRAWTGPIAATFANPLASYSWELPTAELTVYEKSKSPPASGGLSRNRGGGFAGVAGTGDFSPSSQNYGFGMNYNQLTLDHLAPDTAYKVYLWDYDANPDATVWSNPDYTHPYKYVVWSTVNPKQWLDNNGYASGLGNNPNGGYGPINYSGTDSNMPCALKDLALGNGNGGRASMEVPDPNNRLGTTTARTTVNIMTDDDGVAVIYGWLDATTWAGSAHVPLNGFMVVPEPVTIALLGLGGLALLRRKHA